MALVCPSGSYWSPTLKCCRTAGKLVTKLYDCNPASGLLPVQGDGYHCLEVQCVNMVRYLGPPTPKPLPQGDPHGPPGTISDPMPGGIGQFLNQKKCEFYQKPGEDGQCKIDPMVVGGAGLIIVAFFILVMK